MVKEASPHLTTWFGRNKADLTELARKSLNENSSNNDTKILIDYNDDGVSDTFYVAEKVLADYTQNNLALRTITVNRQDQVDSPVNRTLLEQNGVIDGLEIAQGPVKIGDKTGKSIPNTDGQIEVIPADSKIDSQITSSIKEITLNPPLSLVKRDPLYKSLFGENGKNGLYAQEIHTQKALLEVRKKELGVFGFNNSEIKASEEYIAKLEALFENNKSLVDTGEMSLKEALESFKNTNSSDIISAANSTAQAQERNAKVAEYTRNTAFVTAGVVGAIAAAPLAVGAISSGASLVGASAISLTGSAAVGSAITAGTNFGLTVGSSAIVGGLTSAGSGMIGNGLSSVLNQADAKQAYKTTYTKELNIFSNAKQDFAGGFQGGAFAGATISLGGSLTNVLGNKTLGMSLAGGLTSTAGEGLEALSGSTPDKTLGQRALSVGIGTVSAGFGGSKLGDNILTDSGISLVSSAADAYNATNGNKNGKFTQTFFEQLPQEFALTLAGHAVNQPITKKTPDNTISPEPDWGADLEVTEEEIIKFRDKGQERLEKGDESVFLDFQFLMSLIGDGKQELLFTREESSIPETDELIKLKSVIQKHLGKELLIADNLTRYEIATMVSSFLQSVKNAETIFNTNVLSDAKYLIIGHGEGNVENNSWQFEDSKMGSVVSFIQENIPAGNKALLYVCQTGKPAKGINGSGGRLYSALSKGFNNIPEVNMLEPDLQRMEINVTKLQHPKETPEDKLETLPIQNLSTTEIVETYFVNKTEHSLSEGLPENPETNNKNYAKHLKAYFSEKVDLKPEKYDYTDSNLGWKLHLNVTPENAKYVSDYLINQGYNHKFLSGGDVDEGKVFTIYIGSYNKTQELRQIISTDLEGHLAKPKDKTEIEFAKGIIGRFNAGGQKIPNENEHFSAYGFAGYSLLSRNFGEQFSAIARGTSLSQEEKMLGLQIGFNHLKTMYGDYFFPEELSKNLVVPAFEKSTQIARSALRKHYEEEISYQEESLKHWMEIKRQWETGEVSEGQIRKDFGWSEKVNISEALQFRIEDSERLQRTFAIIIKNFVDEETSEQRIYKNLIQTIYRKIRLVNYKEVAGKDDPSIDQVTSKPTAEIKVSEENNWHYRNPKNPIPRTTARISLNAHASIELVTILDNLAVEYGFYYKTPREYYGWIDRHDPVTLYIPESLKENSEFLTSLAGQSKPFIRQTEKEVLFGHKIAEGIFGEQTPTKQNLEEIISEAKTINPAFGDAVENYFFNKEENRLKGSSGMLRAVQEVIDKFQQSGNV